MNRISHGLNSDQPVIAGEHIEEWVAYRDSYRSSLLPENAAQEKNVDFIAQLSWKLDRLNRIENGLYRERLEQAVAETEVFKKFSKTEMALIVVTALQENLEGVVQLRSEDDSTQRFLGALRGTLAILDDAQHLPVVIVAPLAQLASPIFEEEEATPEMVEKLKLAAQRAVVAIKSNLDQQMNEVEKTRELLAEQVLPLQDADVKLIDRYRRSLEVSLQRQMVLLNITRQNSSTYTTDNTFSPKAVQ